MQVIKDILMGAGALFLLVVVGALSGLAWLFIIYRWDEHKHRRQEAAQQQREEQAAVAFVEAFLRGDSGQYQTLSEKDR